MTDLEIYTQWRAAYENIDTRHIIGYISADEADRLVRNMEERLGVNTWTVERWQAAMTAFVQVAGEGA
jgi:hypothetical protein